MKNGKIIAAKIFESIENLIVCEFNKNISHLCKVAGVSRSGYYKYITAKDNRNQKELRDFQARDMILNAIDFRGYKKGSRSIKMTLEKNMALQ